MAGETTPSSFTASTNWVVSHGSLNESISFDSSLAPDDDGQAEPVESPLLVLTPPDSADSSHPCEITVRFQNHFEILQIYVKSTAKIYEIYYASNKQSANEYLCTVRCGIAALDDDEAVHNTDSREQPEHSDIGDNRSVEDGWVEVKNPPSSFTDASADSKMCGENESTSRINQNKLLNYYEATAEITDADPCVSLTLRLLSLEVKGCLQIKEIYIFANPVDSSGSLSDTLSRNETSSSLLSMLVPSILQSSRLGPQFVQDRKDLNPADIEKQKERTEPVLTESGKEQEVRPRTAEDRKGINQKPICKITETGQFETTTKSAVSEEKHFDLTNIERALYQLNYRVSRIEAFVLRFEESILRPINNIEGRLHGLEQKIDGLQIRSYPTKIVAPEFSYDDESRESSFDEEKSTNQAQDASETSKVSHLETSEPPDLSLYGRCFSDPADQFQPHSFAAGEFDIEKSECLSNSQEPSSSIDPKGSPTKASLVLTAPDFSCDDEDISVNESSESLKGSLGKKPFVSIDEALASALEGFLSSTSASFSKAGPALAVRAPEFESEATSNDATFFPPTTLLSEQPENLLSTNEDDSLECSSCVSDELNEETVRISRGPLNSIETAGAGVLDSRSQSLENGENLSENFEYDSTPRTIVESNEMHSGTIQAADAIAAQSDVVPDLASPKDQNGTHILFPDDISSVVGEPDIMELMVATFEQLISDDQLTHTVCDDGSSLELGKISLNLDSDVLDVKFISHEDGFIDAPLEDLLGCTGCTGESASEGNDEHKVPEPVQDEFLVQVADGEVNESEPDHELFVNVDSVTLESVLSISTDVTSEPELVLGKED